MLAICSVGLPAVGVATLAVPVKVGLASGAAPVMSPTVNCTAPDKPFTLVTAPLSPKRPLTGS